MLCEECGKNPATIHYTQVQNGVATQMHLCAACMAKHQKGLNTMSSLISSLLSGVSGQKERPEQEKLRCPTCGMEYERFRETGLLGCADCYKAFAAQLAPMLGRIHGRTQHVGHVPPARSAHISAQRELEKLRREMDEAVAKEEFELAAQLRDRIRAMTVTEEEQAEAAKGGCEHA